MCFIGDYSQNLPVTIWKKKLLPIYPYLKTILLQGGELTSLPLTKKFLALALQHNPKIKFILLTNGLLFNKYWQGFFVNHGHTVNFSLNAASEDIYNTISHGSNFRVIIENIKSFITLKKVSRSKVIISISFVILNKNIHQISAFIELAYQLGVDSVFFISDNIHKPKIDTARLKDLLQQAFEVKNKHSVHLKVVGLEDFYSLVTKIPLSSSSKYKCTSPWDSLFIDQYGQVRSCCHNLSILGNLNNKNIKEILTSNIRKRIQQSITNGTYFYCKSNCGNNRYPHLGLNIYQAFLYAYQIFQEYFISPKSALFRIKRFFSTTV